MAKILIVDDEEEIRNLSSELLTAEGFQVDTAADGHEAIKKASASHYDVALVDLVLPGGLNGIDIIAKIKEISTGTRIVAFTGFSGANIAEKTAKAGADGFMTKPFFSDKLIRTVSKLIDQKPRQDKKTFFEEAKLTPHPVNWPKILKGFSETDIHDFLQLGMKKKLAAGEKIGINGKREIVIIAKGKTQCMYHDSVIDYLEANDAVGESCIFLKNGQDIPMTLMAENHVELSIIHKDKLKKYFSEHHPSLFLRFSANIIMTLSQKLITQYSGTTGDSVLVHKRN